MVDPDSTVNLIPMSTRHSKRKDWRSTSRAVSTPFERSEIHFADAIHYSEFAEDGELSLKEGPGSCWLTRWEAFLEED
ncbi:unnamed protein product [Cochlearia groenlandica]